MVLPLEMQCQQKCERESRGAHFSVRQSLIHVRQYTCAQDSSKPKDFGVSKQMTQTRSSSESGSLDVEGAGEIIVASKVLNASEVPCLGTKAGAEACRDAAGDMKDEEAGPSAVEVFASCLNQH